MQIIKKNQKTPAQKNSIQNYLIVGTTSDYIDILRQKYTPNTLLFLTSPQVRANAVEESPNPEEEIVCELDLSNNRNNLSDEINKLSDNRNNLSDEINKLSDNRNNLSVHTIIIDKVIDNIKQHIAFYSTALKGIACFDCESMELAAHIAKTFALPYPSVEAVRACRDKSITRKLWHLNDVETPEYKRVSSSVEAINFFQHCNKQNNKNKKNNKNNQHELVECVLKPIDSSGSERVFCCKSAEECETAYNIISKPQKHPDIIIETCVKGTEYSSDFIVNQDRVIPIRLTRKIYSPIPVFGTTMAYEIVDFESVNFDKDNFLSLLGKAAASLGITRGICMVDFIAADEKNNKCNINPKKHKQENESIEQNEGDNIDYKNKQSNKPKIYLLEMTPRPGGDCLPWLIKKAMNIDILKLNINFSSESDFSGSDFNIPSYSKLFSIKNDLVGHNLVGLRIHAAKEGVLQYIDTKKVETDSRVKEIFIKQKSGHKITLPPKNYDSWNLGHIIFEPFKNISCKEQCIELLSKLFIEIDPALS